ncbi:exopolyphosphatase [Solemya velesiana gill symbiont]|uniref:Exopolyphosphatase n=1 Tax=Solemya velesiana gill symbiont TaxID=1918948 RepID=A0A1T2KUC6_9GAMM|nr:exopolyphosphatase [Solemya velesiana gill symbiont]OOZ36459.1 exopolyphosphatase [Solemya velesiana gill symbiont]
MFSNSSPTSQPSDTVAAVDLGSNSFHMIVARVTDGDFQVVDKLREMVRLGAGLDENKNLTSEAEARALDCLERFGQRVRSLPPGSVRAVGTNTLRQVRDSEHFLRAAEKALGHPIEIIAGREEARLVYLGVAHGLAAGDERRLVVDIGGGSTELIVGDSFTPRHRESLHMGCVSMSRWHFDDGKISQETMRAAELRGALEIRPVKNEYRGAGWELTIGSSGTIKAIRDVVCESGWSDPRDGITYSGLKKLRNALIDAGHIDNLDLPGLSTERRPVFPGGVAVLRSVFKALKIEKMQVSDRALREGLIYEMLGRIHHEDVRENTVRALCRRYDVDMEHAGRVETTARMLFAQVVGEWNLTAGFYSSMLAWAARLHECGLTVSHSQFQKHGAYLVANSDLAGFSRQEQSVLAALIRGHRRKFPLDVFKELPGDIRQCAMRLCTVLRLSVLLHRPRSSMIQVTALLSADGNDLELGFPEGWLETHTLTHMELEQESKRLKAAGFKLKFK